MNQNEYYQFVIHGRSPLFPYFLFFWVIVGFIILIDIFLEGWTNFDFTVWGSIIMCICIITGGIYAGYFFIMLKTLQIDNRGVRYLFNKRIKIDLSWREINKIKTFKDGKAFFLIINSAGRFINFNNSYINRSEEDLQRAFFELLKYQPTYNFIVEDKVGWSRTYQTQPQNIPRIPQQMHNPNMYQQQRGRQW